MVPRCVDGAGGWVGGSTEVASGDSRNSPRGSSVPGTALLIWRLFCEQHDDLMENIKVLKHALPSDIVKTKSMKVSVQ